MDPTTGIILATIMKPLIDKTTDPETVARGINWLWSAAGHFLRERRQVKGEEVKLEEPTPPQPEAEAIQDAIPTSSLHVSPNLDNEIMDILEIQIESLMEQTKTYAGNVAHLQEKASKKGGELELSIGDRNSLQDNRKLLVQKVNELAEAMKDIYGEQLEGIDSVTNTFGTT